MAPFVMSPSGYGIVLRIEGLPSFDTEAASDLKSLWDPQHPFQIPTDIFLEQTIDEAIVFRFSHNMKPPVRIALTIMEGTRRCLMYCYEHHDSAVCEHRLWFAERLACCYMTVYQLERPRTMVVRTQDAEGEYGCYQVDAKYEDGNTTPLNISLVWRHDQMALSTLLRREETRLGQMLFRRHNTYLGFDPDIDTVEIRGWIADLDLRCRNTTFINSTEYLAEFKHCVFTACLDDLRSISVSQILAKCLTLPMASTAEERKTARQAIMRQFNLLHYAAMYATAGGLWSLRASQQLLRGLVGNMRALVDMRRDHREGKETVRQAMLSGRLELIMGQLTDYCKPAGFWDMLEDDIRPLVLALQDLLHNYDADKLVAASVQPILNQAEQLLV